MLYFFVVNVKGKFKYLTYDQHVWFDSINFAKDRLFELAELL